MTRRSTVQGAWLGSGRIFAAELLILPTGLVTAGVLTRALGADGYGIFALVATVVGWLQATANSMLARAANRTVAREADWRPVAGDVVRLHLITGTALGLAVVLFAHPLAVVLGQPAIVAPLRLLAIDLPLYALASAYRAVFVGTGDHSARANASAVRWIVRMLAVVAFVRLGWSVPGAIAGLLLASIAEVAYARRRAGPLPLIGSAGPAPRRRADLLTLAMPVALAAILSRLFDRVDLFLLAAFGADAATLGHYGAAQNLTVAVSLLSSSVAPVLLATITRCERAGDRAGAAKIMDDALRAPWLLLPFVGLAAGAADGIMRTIYGSAFLPAAAPFSLLMAAAGGLFLVSIGTAMLVAVDRPWLVLAANAPMLLLITGGGTWLIPRYGGTGAAMASLIASTAGGVAVLTMLVRVLGRPLPWRTMTIGTGLAVLAWYGAHRWPARTPPGVVVGLALEALLLCAALIATREARPGQLRMLTGKPAGDGTGLP